MFELSQSASAPDLTVCVFAYNEAQNIRAALDEIRAELRHLPGTWEILAVDDGSTDATPQVLAEMAAEEPQLRVHTHVVNLGLGGAYRSGFTEARGTWLTFFPADRQFPAEIIGTFFAQTPSVDVVLGYLPERRPTLIGQALSAAERVTYRALVGKMPRFQGILMFRRAILNDFPLVSQGRGWGVIMEFVLRVGRGSYRIAHVPTQVRRRAAGVSHVSNLRNIRANLEQVWRMRAALKGG